MKKSGGILRVASIALIIMTFFVLFGCGNGNIYSVNDKIVMTIEENKISYDEYRYFYLSVKRDMDNASAQATGEGVDWTLKENLDALKQSTEKALRKKYAVVYLSDKYKVNLNPGDEDEIKDTIDYYASEFKTQKEYKEWLESSYMTGKLFYNQIKFVEYTDVYLRELLFTGYMDIIKTDDETVYRDVMDNFYRYTQIYVSFDNVVGETGAYDKIIAAHNALENGEDFFDVAEEYNEKDFSPEVGTYAAVGEKIEVVEDAILELEVGEYSAVIATTEGYHIFMRQEPDSDYVLQNINNLRRASATSRYTIYISELAETLDVTYQKYYNKTEFAVSGK